MGSLDYSIDMFDDNSPQITMFEESMIDLTFSNLKLDRSGSGPEAANDPHMNVILKRMCGPSVRGKFREKSVSIVL